MAGMGIGESKTPGGRLKRLREKKGFESAAEAARAIGVPESTYQIHENETQGRGISKTFLVRYARFYRTTTDYLLTGRGEMYGNETLLVGIVTTGGRVAPMSEKELRELEPINPPLGIDFPCVALRVHGDAMYPMLEDGWIIYCNADHYGVAATVAEECAGKLCAVKPVNGDIMIRRLRKGSKRGLWNLESFNAPPIPDVALEWAARVLEIRL